MYTNGMFKHSKSTVVEPQMVPLGPRESVIDFLGEIV